MAHHVMLMPDARAQNDRHAYRPSVTLGPAAVARMRLGEAILALGEARHVLDRARLARHFAYRDLIGVGDSPDMSLIKARSTAENDFAEAWARYERAEREYAKAFLRSECCELDPPPPRSER